MATEQLIYPRGRIALGNGDLLDVTNVKVDVTNNAKQVHTIRRKGAGTTMGTEETTVTYDIAISEDGQEREYLEFVKKGTIKQLRIKVPGLTMTVDGQYKDLSFELPLDDAIKQSMTFIGHMSD
jgi:hypothetical protein